MKKKVNTYLLVFYALAIFSGIINIFLRIINSSKPSKSYPLIFSGWTYFSIFYTLLLLVLGIIVIVLVIKKKIQKIHLIYPIYYLIWYSVWIMFVPFFLSSYYGTIIALETLDSLIIYDALFYIVDIIVPSFFLFWLYKHKK